MSDYTDALQARAAGIMAREREVQARERAIRSLMEHAPGLPGCRVVLADLDGDIDQVNSLIDEAPYEVAISLLIVLREFGAAICGGQDQLRGEIAFLAGDQELRLP